MLNRAAANVTMMYCIELCKSWLFFPLLLAESILFCFLLGPFICTWLRLHAIICSILPQGGSVFFSQSYFSTLAGKCIRSTFSAILMQCKCAHMHISFFCHGKHLVRLADLVAWLISVPENGNNSRRLSRVTRSSRIAIVLRGSELWSHTVTVASAVDCRLTFRRARFSFTLQET